tara:strand:+ start:460 stop:1002 length:543 start_codon:yes stop_codon:yes gene_type:complete
MLRFILVFLFFLSNANADNREKIIERLKKTSNINFKFEQNISGKIENGNCIIKYPKKIFCKYEKSNGKILVSNGKSLVIKTKTSFYRYPLKKTPLNFILDKNYLIKKIYNFEESRIDNKIINYKIFENENEINIFFNSENFNLLGWKIKDMYQNHSIIYISYTKINEEINDNIFNLPTQN